MRKFSDSQIEQICSAMLNEVGHDVDLDNGKVMAYTFYECDEFHIDAYFVLCIGVHNHRLRKIKWYNKFDCQFVEGFYYGGYYGREEGVDLERDDLEAIKARLIAEQDAWYKDLNC